MSRLFILLAFLLSSFAANASLAGRSCVNAKDDLTAMTCNIYFEAGNQSDSGMVAVGRVVLARYASGEYGHTIPQIVYAHAQFSWTLKKWGKSLPNNKQERRAEAAAQKAMKLGAGHATNYYAFHIIKHRPGDLASCYRVEQIQDHVFYRCPSITDSQIANSQFRAAQKYAGIAQPRITAGVPVPGKRPSQFASAPPRIEQASLEQSDLLFMPEDADSAR